LKDDKLYDALLDFKIALQSSVVKYDCNVLGQRVAQITFMASGSLVVTQPMPVAINHAQEKKLEVHRFYKQKERNLKKAARLQEQILISPQPAEEAKCAFKLHEQEQSSESDSPHKSVAKN
jgi:hypothetical protein